ncbi:AEC family transporter [Haloplanus natans]|uniref:AEC family transporter n=1 Tax=Haloplanus natans TaxID=376171 RepID=UPI000677AF41|nr:AEC family transporter [Haloplanus natans]
MSLVSAFTSAILPIVSVMGLGYLLASTLDLDVDPLNDVALYLFLPALIFHSIVTTTLSGATVARIFAGVFLFVVATMGVTELADRLLGVPEPYRSADVLAGALPNAGFYGIPLAEFAFGAIGRTTAVIYITAQAFLMYTLGVYVASRGGGEAGIGAVKEIFRLPLVYAIAAAGVVRFLGVAPPTDGTFMSTARLVGDASIPLMLVIVGIQLSGLAYGNVRRVLRPSVIKLVIAPLVGLAVAVALGGFGDPAVARVFVLLCATPVALIPLALTLSYSDTAERDGLSASEYLTMTIFVTTIASVPVLTVLITLLQDGVVF